MALSRSFELCETRPPLYAEVARQGIPSLASYLANHPNLICHPGRWVGRQNTVDTVRAVLHRVGGDSSALFVPPMDASTLSVALEELLTAEGNLYGVLYKHGFRVIRPAVFTGDDLLLAGGSFSATTLCVKRGDFVVQKKISTQAGLPNVDVDLRLRNERAWLAALPNSAAQLFPAVTRLIETDRELGYEMEFIPWPTASELIFEGCMHGEQLVELLYQVYGSLLTNLYSHPSIRLASLPPDKGYLGRIERRAQAILESDYPEDGILRALFRAQRVIVNGVQCPSPFNLLQRLRSDQNWLAIVEPQDDRLCHGDLVLENILVDDNRRDFRLVDPNPANHSVMFDVAKTLLSLWIGYEFLYYDLFSIEECVVENAGQEIRVTCTLERPDCQHEYAVAAEKFVDFVRHELLPHLGLDSPNVHSQLGVLCGLLALAIPMFHLFHHQREYRALAFACLGLRQVIIALE